jgi:hypothetical protein
MRPAGAQSCEKRVLWKRGEATAAEAGRLILRLYRVSETKGSRMAFGPGGKIVTRVLWTFLPEQRGSQPGCFGNPSRLLDLYYTAKPWLPVRLRYAVRRWHARRLLRHSRASWPILESAGRAPVRWQGWPQGKRFAVVLTHDVESAHGLARVKALAELEMSLGFRSAFFFIPEGPYRLPAGLRAWLVEHGFEVGVHDLYHDGRLFRSREAFHGYAQRINWYLEEWNAVGFRAGFMMRRLDWFHELRIQYDASTFDTDPFEPQPTGAGTIFPFWVSRSSEAKASLEPSDGASSYVELPYTLPQDSTLFVLFRHQAATIWNRKLDWIAARGGMALINAHPDYLLAPGERPTAWAYSAELYTQFLQGIARRHAGAYWQALPKDVAAWERVHQHLRAKVTIDT